MLVACFDMEGVFLPEIWIEVSKITGIKELALTTRDVQDYDELMLGRLRLLDQHGITIDKIQEVISTIKPVEGAREFLDWAKSQCQLIVLSDTFYEFAKPLMPALGWPTLFCHNLTLAPSGRIENYNIRIKDPKRRAVLSFRDLNFRTFACGDSYNDVSMIQEADHGCFFRAPENVLADYPNYSGYTSFDELREVLTGLISSNSELERV
ncbi:MAG: bifunctional phosphoserine phosphatase/homoserine phosphotransferase ThrH [Planctomycetes bacterium]|nr:bifunctional phosphoserine phosphatase/homoserine phosphotransferase ThrH [Planctomycetota bacterium]